MFLRDKYFVFFISITLFIFIGFNPIIGGDTGSYTQIVLNIANFDFAGYDFARTIGYPFFIYLINGFFGEYNSIYPSLIVSVFITYSQYIIYIYRYICQTPKR